MKQHQLILRASAIEFADEVNRLTSSGWLVVPGTTVIKETRSGRQWFSVVMENQKPDSPDEILRRVQLDWAKDLPENTGGLTLNYWGISGTPPTQEDDSGD